MILPDANVLIYAANRDARQHRMAASWLQGVLSGTEAVGFTWHALLVFLRLTTREDLFAKPLRIAQAFDLVEAWLECQCAQLVHPGDQHASILRRLVEDAGVGGNLTSDAHLAAIAIEHGATLVSFDRDFDRFAGLRFNALVRSNVAILRPRGR
jgi:toxin-antitoxin system PIN domain toxin